MQIDNNEYLEIKEDREKYRLEVGQKTIKEFFESKGIIKIEELRLNPEEYMDYYINYRPQKNLGGMPPNQYKQKHLNT